MALVLFFFQKYWSIVGDTVCEAILSTLRGFGMNSFLNSTFFALILEINNPTLVSEFWLINLCNVLYKLVSKFIFNRLQHVIPHLIARSQSTIIPGRLITDNILLARKLLHIMGKKEAGFFRENVGKSGYVKDL